MQDIEGVEVALAGGADRVELCSALAVGGLTPSLGLIRRAVATADRAGKPGFVNVLVRSRPGDYVYEEPDVAVMADDVRLAFDAGAASVVVGALEADGEVDRAAMGRWLGAACGGWVTFHRAMDDVADPARAARALIELGVKRVLTSGAATRAVDGAATLRLLRAELGDAVEVMAGGGVRPEHVAALAQAGVDAVHLSARAATPSGVETDRDHTDLATVRAAVAAARFHR